MCMCMCMCMRMRMCMCMCIYMYIPIPSLYNILCNYVYCTGACVHATHVLTCLRACLRMHGDGR